MFKFNQNLWGGGASRFKLAILSVLVAFCAAFTFATAAQASEGDGLCLTSDTSQVTIHRLYNLYTGEHLYTFSDNEKSDLVKVGWNDEGTGWIAPSSGDPVYRLYNIYAVGGDHHYTKSKDEYDYLKTVGWTQEGVVWYSASESEGVPVYRQYNPYAATGTHNYTTSKSENDQLVSEGWNEEGIGWYGVNSSNSGTKKYTVTFDSNGGSAVDKQTVESGTAASKPANPTKTGYTFVAWFEDESLTMPYYFASKVVKNLTLYAKWQSSTLPTPNPPDSCVTVYRLVNQTTGCYLFTAVKTVVTEKTANGWVN